MGDLARLAGVAVQTIKRYIRHGLLAPVPFYGTATRYPHDYLVRILALRYWRAAGTRTLAELRRRLDSASLAEMEAWVWSHPLPAETQRRCVARRSARTLGLPRALRLQACSMVLMQRHHFQRKAGSAGC